MMTYGYVKHLGQETGYAWRDLMFIICITMQMYLSKSPRLAAATPQSARILVLVTDKCDENLAWPTQDLSINCFNVLQTTIIWKPCIDMISIANTIIERADYLT